jgi:signal transduction histidine kinase/CheY-like chemotaxis protein/HPt (histidine-containing phosphotransfer) domain-containing protein
MSLKRSTVAIISITFLTLAVAVTSIFQFIVLDKFAVIETNRMHDNVERVFGALRNTSNALTGKTIDWAQWDDSYSFIVDSNAKYISSILNYDTLAALRMQYVLYFKSSGDLHYGIEINEDREEAIEIRHATPIVETIKSIPEVFSHATADDNRNGVFLFDNKAFLYSSVPITDSKREKPARGSLVFVQELSESFFKELGEQTRLPVEAINLKKGVLTPLDVTGLTKAEGENKIAVLSSDKDKVTGYGIVANGKNEPILLVRISQARDIYAQGTAARDFLVVALGLLTLAALLCTVFLIDKRVLSRLERLRSELSDIIRTRDVSRRASSLGSDELGDLSSKINEMLGEIAKTQDQLTDARLAAEAASEAKSLFIARVSHELRTPINGITGIHELVMKRVKSPGVRELIKMADNSAWSLLSVINEILDFSKIESGNLTVEKIPFDIRKVARDAMQIVSGRVEGKDKLELVLGIDPNVPPNLKGDPTKLKQILINLLGNAIKFTQQGHVTLSIYCHQFEAPETILRISVADTGIGIPEEKLSTIWEPFKQVDETMTRKYQGTGLGLTIVKQFTEALGGSVKVNSILDRGTTFTIMMPVGVEDSGSYFLSQPGDGWPHVILVDGNSEASKSLQHYLGRFGVPVTSIDSSRDDDLDKIDDLIKDGNLVAVSETAFNRSRVFNAVVEMATAQHGCIIAMLKPSNLDLREKLHGLGIDFILPTPVLADDLILAFQGKLPIAAQSWDDSGDAGLRIGRKLKILVADDAPTNRLILEEMLTEAGHEVVCVNDGRALVERISPMILNVPNCTRFDIVLTDIQMPILDGFNAVRQLRDLEKEQGSKSHTLIIAVTAHALPKEREEMLAAGMDGVVTKPLRAAMIASELEKLLPKQIGAPAVVPPTVIIETNVELSRIVREIWEKTPVEENSDKKSPRVQPEALLDINDLFERSERSIKRTRSILKAFQGSFKEPLGHLARAKISKDITHLKEAAHMLKGLLLDIGAKAPASVAAEIENFCKQNQIEEASRLVGSFTHQVLLLARIIERLCETLEFREDPTKRSTP